MNSVMAAATDMQMPMRPVMPVNIKMAADVATKVGSAIGEHLSLPLVFIRQRAAHGDAIDEKSCHVLLESLLIVSQSTVEVSPALNEVEGSIV